jgi:hypothetical protein
MKTLSKSLIFALFISFFMGFAGSVFAYSPTLSVYSSGNSTTVSISGGQPNAAVVINYTPSGSSLLTSVSGFTDYSGNFMTMVDSGVGSQINATVGGQQVYSNNYGYNNGYNNNNNGCGYSGCNVGGLTLSQNSLSLNVGQSASVTASYPLYGYSNSFYVSSNSNPSVASATASGNQVNVYGLVSGSTNISVCSNSSSACATLYVTVNGGSCYNGCGSGSLSLSQTSLSLTVGQSSTVTVYGYNSGSSAYISGNSNSSVAGASVSGNTVYVNGISNGSTNISICQNSSSQCATLYVTVGGGSSSGSITFSPSSVNLSVGQSSTVFISASYFGTSLYISNNSNPSIVSASITGSSLYLQAGSTGSSTITVCQSNSTCGYLYVTVGGGSGIGSFSLSQTSVSLNIGQTSVVTAYNNGNSIYISNNGNSSVVSASISGNNISLYGLAVGSSTISICASNISSCVSLYVTVGGNGSSGTISFSPSSLSLNSGQSATVAVYNNSISYGSYYISSNSNSGVASASMSGSSIYVNALSAGNTNVLVCQSSSSSSCATLYVTVSGVLGANTNLWFSPANPTLYVGQSLAVSVNSSSYATSYSNNASAYYISSNSSPYVVSANISGTVLNLTANQNGSSNISVCNTALGFCGTVYVTVNGSSYNNGGNLSLSQTSLSLSQSQSMIVSAYNVPSVYISSNSNPSVVTVSVNLNQATFYGQSSGSSTVVLCGISTSNCASVYVTVNGYGGVGNIVLSQTSLGLNVGQSATVNVSGNGGYGYYISQNSNPGVVSASFNGSVISIYAIANGNSTLQICQNSAGSCQSLYITVGSGYSYNGGGSGLQYPGGSGGVLGASTYLNGQLISEGSIVYIVYKNTKTAFTSSSVFLGLGYKFGNVMAVGNSGLADSGYTVSTTAAHHPWGSWIKSGQTIYFVHQSGLIPVPDWNTFLNNGGQASFVVPANSYDFRLYILSPMTSGDSRLQ